MSNLIASQDNDVIVLVDGTRIEVNTSMDGTPCGWIITEAAQQSVHLTGLCVCPEDWSVDIRGNCSNCGLAKTPRK